MYNVPINKVECMDTLDKGIKSFGHISLSLKHQKVKQVKIMNGIFNIIILFIQMDVH